MVLVTEQIEEYDNQNVAYEKTRELIRAYPDLRGIQGSASTPAAGAGLAVEEKGLQDRIVVVGTAPLSTSASICIAARRRGSPACIVQGMLSRPRADYSGRQ
ncbi:MAG: hypothetical protein JW955_11105 [Sedimentisphaerales bacterium]|nr:hypothetical protein [Sedimentisphaerales bacterium]